MHNLHSPEQRVANWLSARVPLQKSPVVLAIGGAGGTGKSTFCEKILRLLPDATYLSLDDFRLPRAQRAKTGLFGSHPDGNDCSRLSQCIAAARAGTSFKAPVFDRNAGRALSIREIHPAPILVCDGEIAAHDSLAHLFDYLVLFTAHWRTQLNTRLGRDIHARKTSLEKAIELFLQSNLRDYPRFSSDAATRADWIFYRSQRGTLSVRKCPDTCAGDK